MVIFPNAKINLGLRILRKRTDGFHDLETCFYPIPYWDALEFIPSGSDSFHYSGQNVEGKNIVEKAIALLRENYLFPKLDVYLYKNIPSGGGLGGGSSDASYTLKTLNDYFSLNISREKMIDLSGKLGKDCPFFIYNKPVMGYETGNVFEDLNLNLKGFTVSVITPPVHINTKEAFSWIEPQEREPSLKHIIENTIIDEWEGQVSNDFQSVVENKFPEIMEIKSILKKNGAIFSTLSGTGSSVVGISRKPMKVMGLFPPEYRTWSATI